MPYDQSDLHPWNEGSKQYYNQQLISKLYFDIVLYWQFLFIHETVSIPCYMQSDLVLIAKMWTLVVVFFWCFFIKNIHCIPTKGWLCICFLSQHEVPKSSLIPRQLYFFPRYCKLCPSADNGKSVKKIMESVLPSHMKDDFRIGRHKVRSIPLSAIDSTVPKSLEIC